MRLRCGNAGMITGDTDWRERPWMDLMSDESQSPLSLDGLGQEAQRWRDALAAGDPDARARLRRVLPNAPEVPTLVDVQHALALEHGFAAGQPWSTPSRRHRRATLHAGAGARSRCTRRWPTRCSRRIAPARPRRWSATTATPGTGAPGGPCARTSSSTSESGHRPWATTSTSRSTTRDTSSPSSTGSRTGPSLRRSPNPQPSRSPCRGEARPARRCTKDRTTRTSSRARATGTRSSGCSR